MQETGIWTDDEKAIGHRHSEKLAEALIKIIPKGIVYDLGCGDGFYTNFLNSNGYDCIGYDGNPAADNEDLFTFYLFCYK